MQHVVDLLNEKNQHLERFLQLNEAELINFQEGNFDNLENFYNSREGILDIIHRVDEMIERSNQVEAIDLIDNVHRVAILNALSLKNDLVTAILSQDLQILSCIESAKSKIIKELAQVRATSKALGSYQSGKPANSLDEEA